ncbi:penicillinase repressor [Capsulimonas corticalis]|uniref:Penicillinase repressor n=1 Tax=Capsulimonas corticalis TaxID=2219043 RepID=A0A402CUS2_9BACT|nr:BlaI/MecI/CopY family transcriptional regulator [Capsulimonas corticalis]BDI29076.1 penicillinase repressor [Capsulimonas corticalis]
MAKDTVSLGKVQLEIMQVLWEDGEATARRITEKLSQSRAIAHSTVQTLLRKMEAKGAVTHDVRDGVFVFRPLSEQNEIARSAARDVLTRVFGGSVSGLVSHLLKHESVSEDELQRLRRLIDEAEPGGKP